MKILSRILIAVFVVSFSIGCSGYNSRSAELPSVDSSDLPLINAITVGDFDGYSGMGIFGAYELTVNPDNLSAELNPMRILTLGESFIVSGTPFFTTKDCFRIRTVGRAESGGILIGYEIKHPFPKGNTSLPPSGKNRLDLDVFDLALVIVPKSVTPSTYQLGSAYTGFVFNPDGYTKELNQVTGGNAAAPYKIAYESSSNNRFAMGTDWQPFDVLYSPIQMQLDLYLTMGYGASAKVPQRLNPIYYVPEFNRKPVWKVRVFPPTMLEGETKSYPLLIDVYDWNHGATVAPVFPDPAHTNYIKAQSDIESVQIEVPDMFTGTLTATTEDSSTNGFSDPLTYAVDIENINGVPEGVYKGLVKVSDSRDPNPIPLGGDILIHTPDGIALLNYTIPEYATYQSFTVKIISSDPGFDWGASFGSDLWDEGWGVCADKDNNVYITGCFQGTIDFDPGPGTVYCSSNGKRDVFICKLTETGDFVDVLTFGSTLDDSGRAIAVDSLNNLYVAGYFNGSVDFDPGSGTHIYSSLGGEDVFLSKFSPTGTWLWTRTWGSPTGLWDEGHGMSIDPNDNIYITGDFSGTNVDFDPSTGGTDLHSSNSGSTDPFISVFDANGNFLWARTWGGPLADAGSGVSYGNGDVYVTGGFQGTNVDFNPGPGAFPLSSNGQYDVYLTNFDYNGNFQVAASWGGPGKDFARGLVAESTLVYVTGYFEETVDFNPGPGTDYHTSNGGHDAFLTLINILYGNYSWTNTWGGAGIWDEGNAVAISLASPTLESEIYVTGCFEETVDFDSGILTDYHSSRGGKDIFLSSFGAPSGLWQWSYTWGTLGLWDEGHAVGSGSLFIAGAYGSGSMDFDPGSGEDWHPNAGNADIFMIKIDEQCRSEIEPNNDCTEAAASLNELYPSVCGAVRYMLDEEDWYRYSMSLYPLTAAISLHNYSGYNLDLYVIDLDCSSVVTSSTNAGAADEYVTFPCEPYGTFYVKVVNQDTSNEPLEYKLEWSEHY